MTSINLGIRVMNAENLAAAQVIISAKSDEGKKPVLVTGPFSRLNDLARQAIEEALALALADAAAADRKAQEDEPEAPACDNSCSLPEDEKPAAESGDEGPQLTLLSFDF